MGFKIVTDSTSDLPQEFILNEEIEVVGLTIQLDQQIYETVGTNAITSQVLLEKMAEGSQPTTSQVNVGQFETVFRAAAQAEQDVLYIGFSSQLSGTYQSAVIAKEGVISEYPEIRIETIDTRAATIGEGYFVMKAAELRSQGKTLAETAAEITKQLPYLRTYLMVDDLHHLVRGGRLSKAAAMIGGLVKIKPILSIDAEGRLVSIAKVRGKKKGLQEMLDKTATDLADSQVLVAYTGDRAIAELLRSSLLENPLITQVLIVPLGPVIATHTGVGTIALLSMGKTARS